MWRKRYGGGERPVGGCHTEGETAPKAVHTQSSLVLVTAKDMRQRMLHAGLTGA